MGIQEGRPPPQQEGALTTAALKDDAQAWITKGMIKSVVAPHQPQHRPVLASADGSLAALCYQGARNASFWVAHKALASLKDNVLKNWAATINLGPSVEALERELLSVKVILESSLGKVIENSSLEDILMKLQDPVYDAEDLLDVMEYFCIQGDEPAKGCALNELPSVHDEPPKLRFNRDNASRRIQQIVEQLKLVRQDVSSAIKLSGPNWSTAPNIAHNRPITISESIEPKLYGRERDLMMKSIIHDITKGKHSAEVLTVIPIVGPGGIGKTTLAQHIYNSGEVKQHFDVRVWTCVSLNFNVNKLIEEVQRYIPKVDDQSGIKPKTKVDDQSGLKPKTKVDDESDTDTVRELIGKRLKNRRLLLVLDDIWDCSDEDEWKRLLLPFRKSQVHGNIIIATTRFPAQVQIMVQKNNQSICLQGLENKELEELFLEIVFGDDDQSRKDHEFLLETGFKIVGKLKGSPLAAKTVGRLLKTKLDFDHWERVLESKEWEHSDGKNDIMPALKLSFHYLPPQLQQCFSYCALFPQDYKFEKEEIINFWIGQEVLHSSHGENKRVEDIGLSHLTELVSYGLLEKIEGKDGRTIYSIHDLLHELALKASSLECLSIDSSQSKVRSLEVLPSIRHLSININGTTAKDRLTLKNCVEDFTTLGTRLQVEKLRTLMIFGEHHGWLVVKAFGDLFREAKALRLVFLSRATYDVKDLLHNFYYLIHLRYLRIESSSLYEVRFPDRISRFYHMKVLQGQNCRINYDLFPRDINNLVKLRHLLVEHDRIHSRIVGVGKLKSLQELRRFVVKLDHQGFELRQIGHLEQLCGSLCINGLENVQVPQEADEAKLMLKSHLDELKLCWTIKQSTYFFLDNGYQNIRPLHPWMYTAHKQSTYDSALEEHDLYTDDYAIEDFDWYTDDSALKGHGWSTNDSALEEHNWSTNDSTLDEHVLERLKPSRNLQKLTIIGHTGATCPSWLGINLSLDSLKSLCLYGVAWKTFPPIGDLCLVNMPHEEISINIPEKRFRNLRRLELVNLSQLKTWAVHAPCQLFPYLEVLIIENCSKLEKLSFSHSAGCCQQGKDANDNLFSRLSKLEILSCRQLSSFPPLPWTRALHSIIIDRTSSLVSLICKKYTNSEYFLNIDGKDDKNDSTFWNVLAFNNLSGLKHLAICPFLPLCYLQMLSSLRTLEMSGLGNVFPFVEADSHVKYQFPVESLTIKEWNASGMELTQLLTYFPKLSYLWLSLREKVTGQQASEEAERGMLLLPPQLQELFIERYPDLSLLSSNPHNDSNKDGRTGEGGLRGLTSLRRLKISSCPEPLSYYSSSGGHIYRAVGMDTLVPLSHLTSLTSLSLTTCGDSRGEGLLSLLAQGHLTKLSITRMPDFFVDPEPLWVHDQEIPSCSSKLQELQIGDVAGFTGASIRRSLTFSSLTKLKICSDKMLEHFTEQQWTLLFVNSLEDVDFTYCYNLQSLPKRLHELTNLKRLNIFFCNAIQIMPNDVLPSSLEELDIQRCPKIQSLPNHFLPDSLQKLRISSCPALQSVPKVDDLPTSLRELDVSGSDSYELKHQCCRFINIIPIVKA